MPKVNPFESPQAPQGPPARQSRDEEGDVRAYLMKVLAGTVLLIIGLVVGVSLWRGG